MSRRPLPPETGMYSWAASVIQHLAAQQGLPFFDKRPGDVGYTPTRSYQAGVVVKIPVADHALLAETLKSFGDLCEGELAGKSDFTPMVESNLTMGMWTVRLVICGGDRDPIPRRPRLALEAI